MKKIALSFSIAALTACATPNAIGSESEFELGWLAGCWQHVQGSTQEVWTIGRGGMLFGHATTLRDGKLSAFEALRIQGEGDRYVYHASPGGSPWVSFTEVARGDRKIVFANPAHDFPQVIAYELSQESLSATISLENGANAIELRMTRCEVTLN